MKRELLAPMPSLHNYFDIVAEDVETGEVIEAHAENVVLDQYYSKIFDGVNNAGGLAVTCVGTGTSTPQKTDTALQNQILARTASPNPSWWNCSQLKEGGTGVLVFSSVMQIEATELVGSVITEVGLSYTGLATRALLQDANGNQIAITKTNTMIVKIYATAYLTLPQTISGYKIVGRYNGSGVPWDMAEYRNNMLNNLGQVRLMSKRRGKTWFEPAQRSALVTPSEASLSISGVRDTPNKRMTFSYPSLPVGSGNIGGIRSICIGWDSSYGGFIEIPVPNDTLVQPVLTKEVIGTGDGTNKLFSSKFGWIRNNGTAKVFVNDIEQTSGVTLKYDQPPVSQVSSYMENTGLTTSAGGNSFENVSGSKVTKVKHTYRTGHYVTASNSPSGAFTNVVYINASNTDFAIPLAYQDYKYWSTDTSYSMGGSIFTGDGDIVFDTAPPAGATIALTYQPDCIAKDDTRILNNLSYVMQFTW